VDSTLFTTTPAICKLIFKGKMISGRIARQTTRAWRIVKVSTIDPILQAACQRSIYLVALADTAQKDAQKTPHVEVPRESWRIRKIIKTTVKMRRRG
jgi:hypothetical protein